MASLLERLVQRDLVFSAFAQGHQGTCSEHAMNPARYLFLLAHVKLFAQLVKPASGRFTVKANRARAMSGQEYERPLHRLGARFLRGLGRSFIDSVYYFCNSLSRFRSA